MRLIPSILIPPVLIGCVCTADNRTASEFESSATIQEAPDGTTLIATVNPPLRIGAVREKEVEQHSIRARIHKKTGEKNFELFERISYKGDRPKGFESVEFQTPAGIQKRTLKVLKREQHCGQYRSGLVCTQLEVLSVPLDESSLRSVSNSQLGGNSLAVHFMTQSGEQYVVRTPTAELAALLKKVDDYLGLARQ